MHNSKLKLFIRTRVGVKLLCNTSRRGSGSKQLYPNPHSSKNIKLQNKNADNNKREKYAGLGLGSVCI